MDADERFLGQIASLTGGGNLANEPATAFLHNLSDQRASQPIFDWLLALAALLLVLDVALRRIVITRSDLDMMRAWLAGRIGLGSVRPATAPATGRMVGLMEAKRRAGSQLSQDEASLAPAVSTEATPPTEKRRGLRRGSGQKEAKKAPASGNLASRLLETRNQQDDQ